MVKPMVKPNGKWIIRPAFLGDYPYVDDSLLKRGYHVAFYDVTHEYGNTKSQKDFEYFITYCINKFGVDKRFVLEGFSRGGFFALCYAINHPKDISGLYLDAPVCNLNSWPKKTDIALYEDAKKKWGEMGIEIRSITNYPIANFDTITKYKIPTVIVYGGKDNIVPYNENFGLIEIKDSSNILIVRKPYCGHHPHSVPNCKMIIDFLDK